MMRKEYKRMREEELEGERVTGKQVEMRTVEEGEGSDAG